MLSQKLTQRCNYPTLKKAWDEHQVKKDFEEYLAESKKARELAEATGSAKKIQRLGAAKHMTTTDDTASEDPMSGGRQSNALSPK